MGQVEHALRRELPLVGQQRGGEVHQVGEEQRVARAFVEPVERPVHGDLRRAQLARGEVPEQVKDWQSFLAIIRGEEPGTRAADRVA